MSAIYRCQHCGCVSDITNSLTAFEENPHCHQCGLSGSESDTKMQDDLASMMARNLNLSAVEPLHHTAMSSPPTPQVAPQPAPITYITQHYHHSAHIAPAAAIETQVSTILVNAGVNASALLPSQLQLFRNAQPDQQQRLIELWSIAPPTPGHQLPNQMTNWPQTSMQQEEAAAHHRWLQQEQQKSQEMPIDSQQGTNGSAAEPYMENGYHTRSSDNSNAEYKHSTDPAYDHSREWWHVSNDQPIEHQYGMLQQMMHY